MQRVRLVSIPSPRSTIYSQLGRFNCYPERDAQIIEEISTDPVASIF